MLLFVISFGVLGFATFPVPQEVKSYKGFDIPCVSVVGKDCFEAACCNGLVCVSNEIDNTPFTCTLETPPTPPPPPPAEPPSPPCCECPSSKGQEWPRNALGTRVPPERSSESYDSSWDGSQVDCCDCRNLFTPSRSII